MGSGSFVPQETRYWQGYESTKMRHKLCFLLDDVLRLEVEQLKLLAEVLIAVGAKAVLAGSMEPTQRKRIAAQLEEHGAITADSHTCNIQLCMQGGREEEIRQYLESFGAPVVKWVDLRLQGSGAATAEKEGDDHLVVVSLDQGFTPQHAQQLHLKLSG